MSILRLNGAVKHIIRLLPFGVVITLLACTPDHNLSTFGVGGPVAEDQKNIFLFIFWVAVAVFVVVEGALIYSVVKFRHRKAQDGIVEQVHGNNRLEIAWTIAPVIILVVIAIPTVDLIYRQSTAPVGRVAPLNPLEINVVGHQWWWEIDYPGEDVITANEVNIPVGRAVKINLTSDDVIHSFWVPKLAGKVDLIPGSSNFLWLQADEPGVYLGQCAEFCGEGHAMMRYQVRALMPDDFQAWLDGMRRPPPLLNSDEAQAGKTLFAQNCSSCHSIRTYETGLARAERDMQVARQSTFVANPTGSGMIAAPNLTHVGSRMTLGAGLVEMNKNNLESWIADPQNIKRGTRMRSLAAIYNNGPADLSPDQISQIAAFLMAQIPSEPDEVSPIVPIQSRSGVALFTEYCVGCHTTGPELDVLVGPGLGQLKSRAADRKDTLNAEEYTRESIVLPYEFIVETFTEVMPINFAEVMSAEEIDSLIAYVLSLD